MDESRCLRIRWFAEVDIPQHEKNMTKTLIIILSIVALSACAHSPTPPIVESAVLSPRIDTTYVDPEGFIRCDVVKTPTSICWQVVDSIRPRSTP